MKRSRQLKVAGNVGEYYLHGQNYGEQATRSQARLALAVLDEDAGSLTIVPNTQIMRMEWAYGKQPAAASRRAALVDEDGDKRSLDVTRTNRAALISTFGSVAKQRVERSKETNRIKEDALAAVGAVTSVVEHAASAELPGGLSAEAMAEAAAAGMSVADAVAQVAEMDTRRKLLPPFNVAATSPADAYPLDGLLTRAWVNACKATVAGIMAALDEEDPAGALDSWCSAHGVARPVKFELQRLAQQVADGVVELDDSVKQRAQLFMQLDAMLHLARGLGESRVIRPNQRTVDKLNGVDVGGGAAADAEADSAGAAEVEAEAEADAPAPARASDEPLASLTSGRAVASLSRLDEKRAALVLREFTNVVPDGSAVKYTVSDSQRLRLRCYLAVSFLHASQFRTRVGILARFLSLSNADMNKAFTAAGCKLKRLSPPKDKKKLAGVKLTADYEATLPVPLKFPSATTRKGGRR